MKLIPAIDLIGGRCVRLSQGDFARETSYSGDPAAALAGFAEAGAETAHIVDLDGARAGEPRQHDLLARLAKDAAICIQAAGGFRTEDQVARVLDAGVRLAVIGSLALIDPPAFARMLERFGPERVTLALDIRFDGAPMVATHGWSQASQRRLDDVLNEFPCVENLLVTDIGRDGMLSGPNLPLVKSIVRDFPSVKLQASGGVANLADLDALRETGASAAIVGKAIWEGRFTVAEGVTRARG